MDRPYNQPSHLYPAKVQICTQHWDAFEEAVEAAVKDTEGTGKVERLCLDMLVGFLDHQLKRGDYDNVVLSALAVLGIREDNGWIDAIDYTPIYSAVVKCARMLVVYQSYLESEEEIAGLMARLRAQPVTLSCNRRIKFYIVTATTLPPSTHVPLTGAA